MLLGALPKTFQDGATKLLHNHLRNTGNSGQVSTPSILLFWNLMVVLNVSPFQQSCVGVRKFLEATQALHRSLISRYHSLWNAFYSPAKIFVQCMLLPSKLT